MGIYRVIDCAKAPDSPQIEPTAPPAATQDFYREILKLSRLSEASNRAVELPTDPPKDLLHKLLVPLVIFGILDAVLFGVVMVWDRL